ncbi:MAG: type II secretion system ATPase GspE [Bacillota bacterium]
MAGQLKKRLGDLLLEQNLITRDQLEEAVRVQKKSGDRLGRVLIGLGYVTEQDILNLLEKQLGITQVKLNNQFVDPDLLKMIPENLARRHKVLPVKIEGKTMTVAMIDPLNALAIDNLRLATGFEILPVMASEQDIERTIRRYYGLQNIVDKALEEVEPPTLIPETDRLDLDSSGEENVDQAPVVRAVNSIIHQAVKDKASDIHIEPHEEELRVRFRLDGVLRDIMQMPKRYHTYMVARIKILAGMDIAERRLPQDGRVKLKVENRQIDLRINTLPTIFGEKVVIRLLDKASALLQLQDLGFQENTLERYKSLIQQAYGIVLVTGPTGSGKTTTLYATLNAINTPEKNIITIEDPVEYVLDGINQVNINPKAGLTFAGGLRSILRQDPDIIMVGEIRDGETADIAVRAATTGHLVFSTLHTNDASGAVTRLVDMGVEPFLVASSVIGVVAQRLVRGICTHCKISYEAPETGPERKLLELPPGQPATLYKGKGCPYCEGSGYRGRVAIHEVMPFSRPLRELVMQKTSAEDLREIAQKHGMITLRDDGVHKALKGVTTIEEVMRVAYSEM